MTEIEFLFKLAHNDVSEAELHVTPIEGVRLSAHGWMRKHSWHLAIELDVKLDHVEATLLLYRPDLIPAWAAARVSAALGQERRAS